MHDTLTNAWFYQLKAANRLLIKKNGGIESAAELTSLSKSQIGRCNNDSDTDLLPLSAVLRLEAECGDFAVTRAMASLHGRKLSDPDATPDGACLMRTNAELSRRVGEYGVNMALALSDLHVSHAEAAKGMADLDAIIEQAEKMKRSLASSRAAGGEKVVPIRLGGEG